MVINQAKNDKELKKMLIFPLKTAVRIVMEKILDANYDCILKVVYMAPDRPLIPVYYDSTSAFLRSWDVAVHTSRLVDHDIEGQFFYTPNKMKAIPPNDENNHMGQHHGVGGKWTDAREYLADIIYQGTAGPIYGDGYWREKRDAFSELLRVVGKRNFQRWMKEAMEEVGLKVKSHGGIDRKDETV